MNIYIPSRSRAGAPRLRALLDQLSPLKPSIVVPMHQQQDYSRLSLTHRVIGCPEDGISKTREFVGQWAKHEGQEKFCMIDDDLKFMIRREHPDWHLKECTSSEIVELFQWVETLLDEHSAVGISARQGNNQYTSTIRFNTRLIRVLAFKTADFLGCEHGRVPVMEDFDVLLQLLRKGLSNACIWRFAQDQQQTQAKGGCSDYRTHERHSAAAEELARLHDPYVKLVQKENKSGGAFGIRNEVKIMWKQAYSGPAMPSAQE